jgi:SagB-type dehydrogenase family enzyme
MRQMDLDYLVILALLATGLYVASTGLIMDLFGFPQFFWHNYVGYAMAILAGIHLTLNWGRVMAYLRRRFRRTPGRESPVQQERTASWGRRWFLASALAAVGGFALGRLIPGQQPVVELPEEATAKYPQGDVGAFYHQWSKPGYALSLGTLFSWGRQPAPYKTYPEAKQIALPDPHGYRGLSLEEAIEQRRSRRNYVAGPLSLAELSRLLHAASGITDPARGFRAAPSAGALYPIETYAVAHNVTGVEPGLYHYAVAEHALEQLRIGDLRAEIMMAGIGQEMLSEAQVCFVLSAIFQRTRWKYRERTYRYVQLEAGHIGQNLYLAATSMGLGACVVGAFLDDDLNDLLEVDGEEEAALYIIAVGRV